MQEKIKGIEEEIMSSDDDEQSRAYLEELVEPDAQGGLRETCPTRLNRSTRRFTCRLTRRTRPLTRPRS